MAGMRVARDDERRAAIARELRMDVVEIEPIDLAVDLDARRRAARRRRRPRRCRPRRAARFRIRRPVGWPRMSTCGCSMARSRRSVICCRVLAERGVHRDDHQVERGEAIVRQIERAIGLDVALDAGEQPDAETLRVDARECGRRARGPAARPARWPSPATGCDR